MSDDLERGVAFEETLRDAAVDRVVPIDGGKALFTPSLPRAFDVNLLRLDRVGDATASELAEEADRLLGDAGLLHRKIVVLEAGAGERLVAGFAELGWKADRYLYMAYRGTAERASRAADAVEVGPEVLRPLRNRLREDEEWTRDEEARRQVVDMGERFARAGNARHFAVLVGGEPVSAADLYSDGQTAQIEDVATLPEHRGHGHASAVIVRALDEALAAGHDFVFLVADDDDWPKELSRKLGFEPLGRKYAFLRPPGAATSP